MSITLSVPPAIVQEVREWATANGTSLNKYLRDCLEAKVNELREQRRKRAAEFRSLVASLPPSGLEPGYKFDRERDAIRQGR